jgi:hypothetical protein
MNEERYATGAAEANAELRRRRGEPQITQMARTVRQGPQRPSVTLRESDESKGLAEYPQMVRARTRFKSKTKRQKRGRSITGERDQGIEWRPRSQPAVSR